MWIASDSGGSRASWRSFPTMGQPTEKAQVGRVLGALLLLPLDPSGSLLLCSASARFER